MNNCRKISLCLCSNIKQYKLLIYNGCNSYCVIVNSLYQCVSFITDQNYINLVAIPLLNGYNQNICYALDLCQINNLTIPLNFVKTEPVDESLKTFTLTDSTYGIPISGSLNFNLV